VVKCQEVRERETTMFESHQSGWRSFLFVTLLIFAASLLMAVCQPDTSLFLNLFVGGPLLLALSAVLIVYAVKGKRRRLSMLTLATVWVVFLSFFVFQLQIRTQVRWSLWSRRYKNTLLAQRNSAEAELKHMEWDGWGFVGMDTTVYLVFDPTDSLSSAASTHQSGRFGGIPCKVPKVSRLENQWYAVTFYTNQYWDGCNDTNTAR
jgi:hypothetical protein